MNSGLHDTAPFDAKLGSGVNYFCFQIIIRCDIGSLAGWVFWASADLSVVNRTAITGVYGQRFTDGSTQCLERGDQGGVQDK